MSAAPAPLVELHRLGQSIWFDYIRRDLLDSGALVRMAELVGQTLGKTPQITLAPTQLGEVTRYVADISKAKELLGYVPQVLLEQGIPRAVAWCRAWDAGKPT